MSAALHARGQAIAAAAQARTVAGLAGRIGDALPDLAIETAPDRIILSAPGLARRMLSDARLRWIGSVLR